MLLPILVSLMVTVCAGDRAGLLKFCSSECAVCMPNVTAGGGQPDELAVAARKRADALLADLILQKYPRYLKAIQRYGDKYESEK